MKHSSEMLAQCACARVRAAARLITRAYDDRLRPTGLKASQLAVLAAVDSMDAPSIAALSKALFMDRTTLSRNLRPLISAELVIAQEDGYGRSKAIKMTTEGEAMLKVAFPLWRRAQEDLKGRLGESQWDTMEKQLQSSIATY